MPLDQIGPIAEGQTTARQFRRLVRTSEYAATRNKRLSVSNGRKTPPPVGESMVLRPRARQNIATAKGQALLGKDMRGIARLDESSSSSSDSISSESLLVLGVVVFVLPGGDCESEIVYDGLACGVITGPRRSAEAGPLSLKRIHHLIRTITRKTIQPSRAEVFWVNRFLARFSCNRLVNIPIARSGQEVDSPTPLRIPGTLHQWRLPRQATDGVFFSFSDST